MYVSSNKRRLSESGRRFISSDSPSLFKYNFKFFRLLSEKMNCDNYKFPSINEI